MIRSDLVIRIAEQNPHLYAKDVEAVVDAILDRIGAALVDGDRVELRGFGTFEVRYREARSARNPRTGQAVEVEARTAIHFRPGKAMRVQLNATASGPG
ncbi:integration host factor subunit beta [Methylobacterium sp. WL64]|uniref:HU family DNA-binding protein n=1 Tax=Methylobacterium sp. WL64 TaxID=2603894 RepID=UPI0011CB9C91|nr:HU family DNA-binding protein [Methylobacterium sp. WL64]TXM96414.1 integration host factor subunit beta [Methylobacterium sp. WL64]